MSESKKIVGVDYGSSLWHMHDGESYCPAETHNLLARAIERYGSDIVLVIEYSHAVPRPDSSENLSHPWTLDQREEFIAAADAAGIEVRLSSPRQTSKFRRVYGVNDKRDENDAEAIALAMRDDKNFRHLHVMRPGFSFDSNANEREFVSQVGRNIEFVKKSDSDYPIQRNSGKVRNGQDYVLELAHQWHAKKNQEEKDHDDFDLRIHFSSDKDKYFPGETGSIGYHADMSDDDILKFMWRLCMRKLLKGGVGSSFSEAGKCYLTLPVCVAACVIDPKGGTRMKLGDGIPGARKIYDTCFSGSDNHGLRGVARSGKQYWFSRLIINSNLPKACGFKGRSPKPAELFDAIEYADGSKGKRLNDRFLQPLNRVSRKITRKIISEMIAMQPDVASTNMPWKSIKIPSVDGRIKGTK